MNLLKKSLATVVALLLLLQLVPVAQASTTLKTVVYVGSTKVLGPYTPFIEKGVMYVPLENVSNLLGLKVTTFTNTDGKKVARITKTVIKGTVSSTTEIGLEQDFPNAAVNGKGVKLPAPPRSGQGKLLVPAKFLADTIGETFTVTPNTTISGLAGKYDVVRFGKVTGTNTGGGSTTIGLPNTNPILKCDANQTPVKVNNVVVVKQSGVDKFFKSADFTEYTGEGGRKVPAKSVKYDSKETAISTIRQVTTICLENASTGGTGTGGNDADLKTNPKLSTVSTTRGVNWITVSWGSGGAVSGATGYRLIINKTNTPNAKTTYYTKSLPYTFKSLDASTTYTIAIAAMMNDGSVVRGLIFPNSVNETTDVAVDVTAPNVPANFRGKKTSAGGYEFRWTHAEKTDKYIFGVTNGEDDYVLSENIGGNNTTMEGFYGISAADIASKKFVVDNNTKFFVRAFDESENESAKAVIGQPNLKVSVIMGAPEVIDNDQVVIKWSLVDGANAYYVYRYQSSLYTSRPSSLTAVKILGAGVSSYEDVIPANETELDHKYYVVAKLIDSSVEEPVSDDIEVTANSRKQKNKPVVNSGGALASITAISANQIKVTFPSGLYTDAEGISKYTVEYRLKGETVYKSVAGGEFNAGGTFPATVTINGLTTKKTYQVIIKATDTDGNTTASTDSKVYKEVTTP